LPDLVPSRPATGLVPLGQALRSARGQTRRHCEIIVVDDTSDDDTPAMLSRDFPEVRMIRHAAARGPAGARNAGAAAARGDWVFLWDDDHLMHPRHIAALIQAQHAAPPDTLITSRVRSFIVPDGEVRLSPVVCAPAERPAMATLEGFVQPHRRGSLIRRPSWTELLRDHPEREIVDPAMRDGLMAVMIELSGRRDVKELKARLDVAFRQMGRLLRDAAAQPDEALAGAGRAQSRWTCRGEGPADGLG
jgi:glycosyltransferase involved in cell wall biosynthesis